MESICHITSFYQFEQIDHILLSQISISSYSHDFQLSHVNCIRKIFVENSPSTFANGTFQFHTSPSHLFDWTILSILILYFVLCSWFSIVSFECSRNILLKNCRRHLSTGFFSGSHFSRISIFHEIALCSFSFKFADFIATFNWSLPIFVFQIYALFIAFTNCSQFYSLPLSQFLFSIWNIVDFLFPKFIVNSIWIFDSIAMYSIHFNSRFFHEIFLAAIAYDSWTIFTFSPSDHFHLFRN